MSDLTVIMPARNAAATVATAIGSTLRSLPSDGAMLVLDDASTDDTAGVVRRLAARDSRLGLLSGGDTPLGVAEAANTLVDAAHTRWIARTDADDISLPARLRLHQWQMRRHELDLGALSSWFYGPGPRQLSPQLMLGASSETSRLELLLNCPFPASALCVRREAMVEVGGYRAVPAEDWDLYMRMALAGARIERSAVPGSVYRRHASQMTASASWQDSLPEDQPTAQTHRDLCRAVLGQEYHAYPALCGAHASPDQVADADQLIDEVQTRAGEHPPAQRLSVVATARGVRIRLRQRYGERHDVAA